MLGLKVYVFPQPPGPPLATLTILPVLNLSLYQALPNDLTKHTVHYQSASLSMAPPFPAYALVSGNISEMSVLCKEQLSGYNTP